MMAVSDCLRHIRRYTSPSPHEYATIFAAPLPPLRGFFFYDCCYATYAGEAATAARFFAYARRARREREARCYALRGGVTSRRAMICYARRMARNAAFTARDERRGEAMADVCCAAV